MSLTYSKCCIHCPSNQNKMAGKEDEESLNMKNSWSKEALASEGIFHCAWRRKLLCKGIINYFELSEEDLVLAGWHHCEVCNATVLRNEKCYLCHPMKSPLEASCSSSKIT